MTSNKYTNTTLMEKALIVISYVVFWLLGNMAAYIIQIYHKHKPLGMQTLLGKTIRLLVKVYHISSTVWVLGTTILAFGVPPLPYSVSLVLTATGMYIMSVYRRFGPKPFRSHHFGPKQNRSQNM